MNAAQTMVGVDIFVIILLVVINVAAKMVLHWKRMARALVGNSVAYSYVVLCVKNLLY